MGWRLLLCCSALLGQACVAALAQAAQPVQVVTSELPPFAVAGDPAAPGALHEIVLELGRRTGIPVAVRFVPWRRAVFLSTSNSRTAIFPLTRSPEREHRYRWLVPLYHEHFLFMARKGGAFNIDHPVRSKQLRVGVLRGSLMIPHLKDLGYVNVVEASTVHESLRFLQRGIVDAVMGDRNIYHASLKGKAPERYAMSEPIRQTTTWLGGSLDFSDADAALFRQALDDMTADGHYARILRKYSLHSGQ